MSQKGRPLRRRHRLHADPLARAAARSLEVVTAAGVESYDRTRHLPRLLPIAPDEIADDSVAAGRRIVARLARALRAERSRGRAGHWTYDLNRHIGLKQAYAAERARLASGADAPADAARPRDKSGRRRGVDAP